MIGDPPMFLLVGSGNAPRIMPVLVPMPEWPAYVTIVVVDKDGNVSIWTDQPKPTPCEEPK